MEKIDIDQYLEDYPKLANIEELKEADVLVMPLYKFRGFNPKSQDIFREFSENSELKCMYYSEDQKKLHGIFKESLSIELTLNLGDIISTIPGFIGIYLYLKDQSKNETLKDRTFRITNIVRKGDDYYRFKEFEGNIDQYKEYVHLNETQLKK